MEDWQLAELVLEELNSHGFDINLVSSGAVEAGRQRLKYRRLINSSFVDLQKPQVELDGKACAAVGQNTLMALYDTFSQVNKTSIIVDASKYIEELKGKVERLSQDVASSQSSNGQNSLPMKKNCPRLLVTILKAFEELGLDVLDANVSCSDNFRLEAVGGEFDIILMRIQRL